MSVPALHSVVPSLALVDLQQQQISLMQYKHRQPVVLVFCGADDPVLQDFARCYPDYQATKAEVLAVVPAVPPVPVPYPVLLDEEGAAAARFVERLPAVLVLDSYNVLFARLEGPWPEGLPHRDIQEWIALKELHCPECGVPDWPGP